jgi:hypothetical protein
MAALAMALQDREDVFIESGWRRSAGGVGGKKNDRDSDDRNKKKDDPGTKAHGVTSLLAIGKVGRLMTLAEFHPTPQAL